MQRSGINSVFSLLFCTEDNQFRGQNKHNNIEKAYQWLPGDRWLIYKCLYPSDVYLLPRIPLRPIQTVQAVVPGSRIDLPDSPDDLQHAGINNT